MTDKTAARTTRFMDFPPSKTPFLDAVWDRLPQPIKIDDRSACLLRDVMHKGSQRRASERKAP